MCTNPTKKAFNAILPYQNKSYSSFLDLLSSATPYVSYFGVYRVSLKGHKGSISLWEVERLVVDLIHANLKFNVAEKKLGESITQSINAFNMKCRQIVMQKSCLKKVTYKIVKIYLAIFRCNNQYGSKYYHYFNRSVPEEIFQEFPDLTYEQKQQIPIGVMKLMKAINTRT